MSASSEQQRKREPEPEPAAARYYVGGRDGEAGEAAPLLAAPAPPVHAHVVMGTRWEEPSAANGGGTGASMGGASVVDAFLPPVITAHVLGMIYANSSPTRPELQTHEFKTNFQR